MISSFVPLFLTKYSWKLLPWGTPPIEPANSVPEAEGIQLIFHIDKLFYILHALDQIIQLDLHGIAEGQFGGAAVLVEGNGTVRSQVGEPDQGLAADVAAPDILPGHIGVNVRGQDRLRPGPHPAG